MIALVILLTFFYGLIYSLDNSTDYLRPQFHLTAPKGWINDPNGLFYDRKDKIWHAYYQHNPNSTTWASPISWGHSTSKDLLSWNYQGIAIQGDNEAGSIFTGSIVIDKNNTSGFFNDTIDPEQRIVAIYTLSTAKQTQQVAYSLDSGYSFVQYSGNPIINLNTTQQRDPKVFWHDESQNWIMVLAMSQEFEIQIYSSSDLKNWEFKSNFSKMGYLGFQYECPGLFKLPIENPIDETITQKWVMVVSINPGSPLGGSINQYFIGDFDGETFHADDEASRFMDLGKDFYAFQSFDNVEPEDGVLGLAWASNWQYGNSVPTDPWRSSMTLVRNYTLRYVNVNPESYMLNLIQRPVLDTAETRANNSLNSLEILNEYDTSNVTFTRSSNVKTDFNTESNSSGVFDFDLTFKITDFNLNFQSKYTTFGIRIYSQDKEERFEMVFDVLSDTWFIDRGTKNSFQTNSPIFSERSSIYVGQMQSTSTDTFHVYGIVDRDIMELYFNEGAMAMTNTFFFSDGQMPGSVEVVTDAAESFITIEDFTVRELGLK